MEKKDFSKKKTAILLAVVVLFCLGIAAIVFIQQYPKMQDFGTSGLFNEEVVKNKSTEIIELFNNKEYQKILDEYASAGLKESADVEDLQYAAAGLGSDIGQFKEISSISLAEMEKGSVLYAVAESTVVYENKTVIFTFSYNVDMEFSGVYMKEVTE